MTPPLIRSRNAAPEDPPSQDNRKALIWAVLVHLLLLGMLIFGVSWRSENPAPMQVELWADGNSPVSPPPDTPKPPEPRPEPKPEPKPEPEPEKTPPPQPQQAVQPKEQPDPEIALEAARKKREAEEKAREAAEAAEAAKEKARLEDIRKQAELKEKKRLEQEKEAADKAAADKKAKEDAAKKVAAQKEAAEKAEKAQKEKAAADKAAAEKAAKDKAEAAKKAAADKALRDAFRNDAMGAAGIPGGTADRNQAGGGTDSGYGAKVRACILPGVAYPTPARGGSENPTVEFRVQLGSDGKVNGLTLTSSSGNDGFDRAVETGIRRCNPFPKPSTGRYASYIDVVYKMYD